MSTRELIEGLYKLKINWPYATKIDWNHLSSNEANQLIDRYIDKYDELKLVLEAYWIEPLVGLDPFNALCLEWFVGDRKLTLYIEKEGIYYITGYRGEFLDGSIINLSELVPTYKWLIGKETQDY